VRGFIEAVMEEELAGAMSRPRYSRLKQYEREAATPIVGVRHGHRGPHRRLRLFEVTAGTLAAKARRATATSRATA
jgi:hypothetical protein